MPRPLEVLVTCSRAEDRFSLGRILARCGFKPVLSSTVENARGQLARRPVRLVFCEDELPDGSVGLLLEEIGRASSPVPVVVISRLENWDEYLRAMRLGAFDYISTPIRRAEVERVLSKALEETPTPPAPPHVDPDGDSDPDPVAGKNGHGKQTDGGEAAPPHEPDKSASRARHALRRSWRQSMSAGARKTRTSS